MTLRRSVAFLAFCIVSLLGGPIAKGQEPTALTMQRLAAMSDCEREQLYRQSGPAPIPNGYLKGLPIYAASSPLAGTRAKVTASLWHGKLFDAEGGSLINQWTGFKAIRARVYPGESWLDGKPSLIMDYQGSSLVWNDVRDELREVAPGLYLGAMYLRRGQGPKFKMWFALEAESRCKP